MSIKGNVFTTIDEDEQQNPDLLNIRKTMRISPEGDVSFKSNLGRGSGTPVSIPGDSFDDFVQLMQYVAEKRESIAEEERQSEDDTISSESADTE